jgi:hypothetical protein
MGTRHFISNTDLWYELHEDDNGVVSVIVFRVRLEGS